MNNDQKFVSLEGLKAYTQQIKEYIDKKLGTDKLKQEKEDKYEVVRGEEE